MEDLEDLKDTLQYIHTNLQHKEIVDWNKSWDYLLKNVSDLQFLVSPMLGLHSLPDVYQFIITLFKCCLQCSSCNTQSVNLAFKFVSATLILENVDFLETIIPCLLNKSCQHMLNNSKSAENNIFFQYIQFILTNHNCKTLNIWKQKTYRQRCLSLIFGVNGQNNQLPISYRHLCLLSPWYLEYFQDLLPFISILYQQISPDRDVNHAINTILQCDRIQYINHINNAIDTLQAEDKKHSRIESIVCILIYNNNFNYNNLDILHFNKAVATYSCTMCQASNSNNDASLLLLGKLCEKYSLYCINNEEMNAIMNDTPFKLQSIQDVIEKSKANMFDDNILRSVLFWIVMSSMFVWLNGIAADFQANERIFALNHSSQYLPDIIHDNISSYFWNNNSIEWHIYSDWILVIQCIVCVIVIFTSYPKPFHFIRLYLRMYCVLLSMRVISFSVTVLPTALPECKQFQADTCGTSPATFYCNDFMFSGHTTTSWLLMVLYYLHIFRVKNAYIYWYESKFIQLCKQYVINLAMCIQLMASILMVFVLTCGHVHYTVDVVIALYLVFLLTAVMWRSI